VLVFSRRTGTTP